MFPRRIIFAAISISIAASFLLCGYEFIRAVSNSLFVESYGAENLSRAMVAVPPGLVLLLYVYGILLSRLGGDAHFGDNLAAVRCINLRVLHRALPRGAFRLGYHLCFPRGIHRDYHRAVLVLR